MYANSRLPVSTQSGIHPDLPALLDRHARTRFHKPIADYNRAAFAESWERYRRAGADTPLILDSCCGVGESSVVLAREFPRHYVIGVDQSASRLARGRRGDDHWPVNLDLIRADVVDYWRLLHAADVRLARHYLLYPNPWPKSAHLGRRWHGHAVFPCLLALGGLLECRSNWPLYLAEFCLAVHRMTGRAATCEAYLPASPMTPFERKYQASGHGLWRCRIDLD